MKSIAITLCLMFLVGCGGRMAQWNHPNYDADRYRRDRAECKLDALRAVKGLDRQLRYRYPGKGFFQGMASSMDRNRYYNQVGWACMESKGYYDSGR